MKNMQPSGNFFYINGDSWLSHRTANVANSDNPLFKDVVVVNHSVPGSGNLSIIRRTKHALEEFKKHNIYPFVCVGLSEVGRDFTDEFALARPQENVTEYLKSVLLKEIEILKNMLKDHRHYVSTAWTTDPTGEKSLISFIEEDFSDCAPVYTVQNGIYNWLNDRSKVFKFSKESFVQAVENKQYFENKLLKNKYVNNTIHLDNTLGEIVYKKYFEHVFLTINKNYDNY
jgi:hypothetical protein